MGLDSINSVKNLREVHSSWLMLFCGTCYCWWPAAYLLLSWGDLLQS